MSGRYLLSVDLHRLRRNLSKENQFPFTGRKVLDWLVQMGFLAADGGWIADAAALGRLEPDEILAAAPLHPPPRAAPADNGNGFH